MDICKIISGVISFPKSLIFNIIAFGLTVGIKTPVFIHWKVRIRKAYYHCIKIMVPVESAMIKIGFGGTDCIFAPRGELYFEKGTVEFYGKSCFAAGVSIRNSGLITIGKDFYANKNCRIACSKEIVFGDDTVLGWNVRVRDSDGHNVYYKGEKTQKEKPVHIGNHVWLCSEASILKGVNIPDNCIVGYGSVVAKSFDETNVTIGGNPADIIKRETSWEH